MNLWEIILVGLGLSADAFAVSVTNGICAKSSRLRGAVLCGIFFGLFQGAMPVLGYSLGLVFSDYIGKFDHWIALVLLGFIGINMMVDSGKTESLKSTFILSTALLLTQGLATSVDALAVGISLSALGGNILLSAPVIASVTFAVSFAGFFVGKAVGNIFTSKAEFFGGLVLLCIGLKIFVSHICF